ncbi:hypothetical protein A3A67_02490 [Candidatus Peribacteria bacterium RIFCSPLOWO2_01_FULL_51_18]|nr:MAG: hypothetical protein A3C52_00380 [Candidatus Peribacteria bacterium RIFCSPHIGHO2_02_FULL_51_15]OGJ66882.1 MAG: hypothetical protein A3A67_02490 [Candidatus Peribacteria bacterium RIFCSPLOWO2_01_FULL_51_18]OGJ68594.1 MAG: hypothetical protein A3J34_04325 [Candidatus Peribacteria bacterium RIFCSPLOWO2_02_FULL_51_10]
MNIGKYLERTLECCLRQEKGDKNQLLSRFSDARNHRLGSFSSLFSTCFNQAQGFLQSSQSPKCLYEFFSRSSTKQFISRPSGFYKFGTIWMHLNSSFGCFLLGRRIWSDF